MPLWPRGVWSSHRAWGLTAGQREGLRKALWGCGRLNTTAILWLVYFIEIISGISLGG